jgi:hypothetical protein
MAKPYAILNEMHTTLASQFVHGTDVTMVLTDASNFDPGGGYVRVETTDGTHWALHEYTGISTNTLTGITACTLGIVESDVAYTFPALSLVGRAIVAEDVSEHVTGPASATDGDFVQFDGTTGKKAKGGLALDTDNTLADDSDVKVPSQKAVKGYVDANAGADECGDGADGDVTISGNTTLTRHMNYNNLTVNNGVTLYTAGFEVRVAGTLTNNGTISVKGGDGGNASSGMGGAAGTPAYTTARGYLAVPGAGGAGGNGGSTSDTLFGAAGPAGIVAVTAATAVIIRAGAGGGGGGGKGDSPTSGTAGSSIGIGASGGIGSAASTSASGLQGGGGSGAGGGVIFLVSNVINNAGTITAAGGNGGNSSGTLGGKGGGGGGGTIYIRYRSTAGSGLGTRTVSGGAAGTTGNSTAAAGTNGTSIAEQIA